MDIERRHFLQALIGALPAVKLLGSLGTGVERGRAPAGIRLGWDELKAFYPKFAQHQLGLVEERGLMLCEDGPPERDGYYKHFTWPPYDPANGLSVVDAYVRAVHANIVDYPPHKPGLEGWLAGNTSWCVFDKPFIVGDLKEPVSGVFSWNEPGEPGGSNPGPSFWFLKGDEWVYEDELTDVRDRGFGDDEWTVLDAFYEMV